MASIVRLVALFQPATILTEARHVYDSHLLQCKLQGGGQHAESVLHATAEIDGRSFLEILRRARDLSDAESEVHALCKHLVIENEVIGIFYQRKFGEYFAAEGAVSGVVLGKLHAKEQILKGGEQPVGDVFVQRHAAQQGAPADDA